MWVCLALPDGARTDGSALPIAQTNSSFNQGLWTQALEKQFLAARKLQVAEASSIVTNDSRKTVYGVCVVSVKIHVLSYSHSV